MTSIFSIVAAFMVTFMLVFGYLMLSEQGVTSAQTELPSAADSVVSSSAGAPPSPPQRHLAR